MFKLSAVRLMLPIFLSLSGCASHHGMILPLPDGAWAVRSECATWAVLFPLRDLTKVSHKVSPDGEHIYIHLATGPLNISMWMEPINGYCGGSAQCAIAEKLKKQPSIVVAQSTETFDIETLQHERFSAVEYFVKTWPASLPPPAPSIRPGDEVNQLNASAVMFKDGYWVDIHISTAGVDAVGEKLANNRRSFRTILANTKVIPQKSVCH